MINHRFIILLSVAPLLAACAHTQKPKTTPPPLAPATTPSQKTQVAAKSQAAPSAAIPAAPKGKLANVYGQVVSFDAATHKLTIKDKRGVSRAFVVASDAKLTKGGDEAKIDTDDLKAGEHVSLKCGGEIAAAVHVKIMAQPASSGQVAKH